MAAGGADRRAHAVAGRSAPRPRLPGRLAHVRGQHAHRAAARTRPASARVHLPPSQDLVTGYWRELLDTPVPQTAARAGAGLAALRASAVPYLFIAGHELEPEYEEWLADRLPQVSTAGWPGGGHFPHLAHPRRFARRLAATGRGGGQAVSAA